MKPRVYSQMSCPFVYVDTNTLIFRNNMDVFRDKQYPMDFDTLKNPLKIAIGTILESAQRNWNPQRVLDFLGGYCE